eukprot:UN07226
MQQSERTTNIVYSFILNIDQGYILNTGQTIDQGIVVNCHIIQNIKL